MAILWTEDLATGSELIDSQHKELFRRINSLLEACKVGKGKIESGKIIKFLEDYVETHFEAEEVYMHKYDYPDFEKHREQHRIFKKNFQAIKDEFEAEGPVISVVVQINQNVVDWLNNHIRKLDKALGTFLKTKEDKD